MFQLNLSAENEISLKNKLARWGIPVNSYKITTSDEYDKVQEIYPYQCGKVV